MHTQTHHSDVHFPFELAFVILSFHMFHNKTFGGGALFNILFGRNNRLNDVMYLAKWWWS